MLKGVRGLCRTVTSLTHSKIYKISSRTKLTSCRNRGCFLTKETSQFQCNVGSPGDAGFSIACDKTLTYNGDNAFFQCPTSDSNQFNIYKQPLPNRQDCRAVKLTTNNCFDAALCPSANTQPAQQPQSQQSQGQSQGQQTQGQQTQSQSQGQSSGQQGQGQQPPIQVPQQGQSQGQQTQTQSQGQSQGQQTQGQQPPIQVPQQGQPSQGQTQTQTQAQTPTPPGIILPGQAQTMQGQCLATLIGQVWQMPTTVTVIDTLTQSILISQSMNPQQMTQAAQAMTIMQMSPNPTAMISMPNIIYNPLISPVQSTVFHFVMPQQVANQRCSLVMLLQPSTQQQSIQYTPVPANSVGTMNTSPTVTTQTQSQSQTQTHTLTENALTMFGNGQLQFHQFQMADQAMPTPIVSSPVTPGTFDPSAIAAAQAAGGVIVADLGAHTMTSGQSIVIDSFDCPAGQQISYLMSSVGQMFLNFYQDSSFSQ